MLLHVWGTVPLLCPRIDSSLNIQEHSSYFPSLIFISHSVPTCLLYRIELLAISQTPSTFSNFPLAFSFAWRALANFSTSFAPTHSSTKLSLMLSLGKKPFPSPPQYLYGFPFGGTYHTLWWQFILVFLRRLKSISWKTFVSHISISRFA